MRTCVLLCCVTCVSVCAWKCVNKHSLPFSLSLPAFHCLLRHVSLMHTWLPRLWDRKKRRQRHLMYTSARVSAEKEAGRQEGSVAHRLYRSLASTKSPLSVRVSLTASQVRSSSASMRWSAIVIKDTGSRARNNTRTSDSEAPIKRQTLDPDIGTTKVHLYTCQATESAGRARLLLPFSSSTTRAKVARVPPSPSSERGLAKTSCSRSRRSDGGS